jgi:hypothetical protein
MEKLKRSPAMIRAEVHDKFIAFCRKHGFKIGVHVERALEEYIVNTTKSEEVSQKKVK